jgi:hypothetical protein
MTKWDFFRKPLSRALPSYFNFQIFSDGIWRSEPRKKKKSKEKAKPSVPEEMSYGCGGWHKSQRYIEEKRTPDSEGDRYKGKKAERLENPTRKSGVWGTH